MVIVPELPPLLACLGGHQRYPSLVEEAISDTESGRHQEPGIRRIQAASSPQQKRILY